jgi:hypothetical protein
VWIFIINFAYAWGKSNSDLQSNRTS